MAIQVIEKLEKEIGVLEHELHHELPKEIQRARELGDLSENAEYAAAKERQDFVGARIAQLRKRLANFSMIDFSKISRDRIGLGSIIEVVDTAKGENRTYELVTSEESDVPNGKISTSSPIGKAFLGKEEGDEVTVRTPGGVKEFAVVSLTTVHDRE